MEAAGGLASADLARLVLVAIVERWVPACARTAKEAEDAEQ